MHILLIGATGTIGRAVATALSPRHQITTAGRKSANFFVDIRNKQTIMEMFEDVGELDAVVVCAGGAAYKPLEQLTDDDFAMSLLYKLMGQVNVARLAIPRLRDGGSITLTAGTYSREPTPSATAIAIVNAGLEGFGIAAALDLPRLRINIVSPPVVGPLKLDGDKVVVMPAEDVARAYVESVEGNDTGRVIDTRAYARRPGE